MSLKATFSNITNKVTEKWNDMKAANDDCAIYYLSENPEQSRRLRNILKMAETSSLGSDLMAQARANKYSLSMVNNDTCTVGSCNAKNKELTLNGKFNDYKLICATWHESAHCEQNAIEGILDVNKYNYPSKVIFYRSKEADAVAKETLSAWQAKENGYPDMWEEMLLGDHRDVAKAMEFHLKYKDTPNKEKDALFAGFNMWFRNFNYREHYDNNNMVKYIKDSAKKGRYITTGLDVDLNLLANKMCSYKGETYFKEDASILYEPLYSAVSPNTYSALCQTIDAMPVSPQEKTQSGAYDLQVYSYLDPFGKAQERAEKAMDKKLEQIKLNKLKNHRH